MRVVEHDWHWAHPLARRHGDPPWIVWHHAAGSGLTAEDVHREHIARGWAGIGYHWYVRRDGSVHRGRPEWAIGAHAEGANTGIGVCAEGNYDVQADMPQAQLSALRALARELSRRYPRAQHIRHRDVKGSSTACPGRHFPFTSVTGSLVPGLPVEPVPLTPRDVTVPRPPKGRRPGWWNLGLRPYVRRLRAAGQGDRVRVTRDTVTVPVPRRKPKWWARLLEWARRQR